MDLKQFYEENEDFKRYVDASMRVSFKDRTLDEFLKLKITKEVAKQYQENRKDEIVKSEQQNIGECK